MLGTDSVQLTTPDHLLQQHTSVSQQSNRFTIVRLALGGLLLVAAALKAHQLATAPVAETGLLTSRWFLIGVVECELGIGLWFLGGWHPRAIRVVGIACFALFGGIALYKALQGAESCGCFGRVAINPWWTAALDFIAVAALTLSHPATDCIHKNTSVHNNLYQRGWLAGGLFVLLGLPAGWAMATFSAAHVSEDGLLGDGQIVVLEPKEWIGKPFPLVNHIDLGNRLTIGVWKVLLYHHDCPKCQEAIAKWQAADQSPALGKDSPTVALIDMPPYGASQSHPAKSHSRLVYGRLSDKREWFATAPVEIDLHDGSVVGVTD